MKKTTLTALLAIILCATAQSQLKSQSTAEESASASLVRPGGWNGAGLSSFFGLLDPDRFHMRHSLSYNYLSAGAPAFTGELHQFDVRHRDLDVRFDVTLQGRCSVRRRAPTGDSINLSQPG